MQTNVFESRLQAMDNNQGLSATHLQLSFSRRECDWDNLGKDRRNILACFCTCESLPPKFPQLCHVPRSMLERMWVLWQIHEHHLLATQANSAC